MGAFLDKPKTEKFTSNGEGNGIRYGVSAMQGWRMEMEDAHVCQIGLPFGKNYSFFGVFDGHAGPKVAQYCAEHLLGSIDEACPKKGKKDKQNCEVEVSEVKDAIYKGFIKLDEKLKSQTPWLSGEDRSGTTAVVAMITPDKLIWANCGDSRGFLCRSEQVEYATTDHKPYNETERNRIEKAGGTVMMQRVNGSLAVSRALGDFDYKRSTELPAISQLVSPEPEMEVMDRDVEKDQFLLLACDGIFDVMSNEEVVKYVSQRLKITDDLSGICSSLIDTCLNKNSRDNMSVILITFPASPKVSEEAIKKAKKEEEEVLQIVTDKIKELVDAASDPIDVEENCVMDALSKCSLPKDFDVYTERAKFMEILSEKKKEKFGNEDDVPVDETQWKTWKTDPADAPRDLAGDFGGFYNADVDSTQEMPSPQQDPLEPQSDALVSHPDTTSCEDTESATNKTIM